MPPGASSLQPSKQRGIAAILQHARCRYTRLRYHKRAILAASFYEDGIDVYTLVVHQAEDGVRVQFGTKEPTQNALMCTGEGIDGLLLG